MRHGMHEVIVERPRENRHWGHRRKSGTVSYDAQLPFFDVVMDTPLTKLPRRELYGATTSTRWRSASSRPPRSSSTGSSRRADSRAARQVPRYAPRWR